MRFIALDFSYHIYQHASCSDKTNGIAYRHREPDAIQFPPFRQNGEQRDEEEHLSGNTEEDALSCVSDTLEKVSDDHLCAYQRESCYNKVECPYSLLGQFRASTEDVNHWSWYQFTRQKSHKGNARRSDDAVSQYQEYSVILACSPVVSDDGLHALHQSEDDSGEKKDNAIDDTVGTDGHIASVFKQSVVADEYNQTGTAVHQEWTKTDSQTLADDIEPQTVDTMAQMQQFCWSIEEPELPTECDELGDNRCPGNAFYAPMEHEDEERVKDAIDYDS
jgi:hypothetical protein